MAWNCKKWALETSIEFINIGKGTIEVYITVKDGAENRGKTITVGPDSSEFVKVKDFLPPGIDEPWTLNENDCTINVVNTGTESSQFSVLEEGPFRKSEFEPEYA